MSDLLLVELYAGLASLSLWCVGGKPPFGRQGSKQGYAEAIAGRLFPGERPSRFLLNDADEGVANTLRVLIDPALRERCAELLDEDAGRASPLELWRERSAQRFEEPAREAARWMVDLCGRAFNAESGGPAMRSTKVPRPAVRRDAGFGVSPATVARRIRALSLDPSRFEVRHGPAETLEPIPGAVAYLDPPYAATASYHSVSLLPPRSLAERWARAGCRVGLSEMLVAQAPLGWPCHDLSGEGRGASRHKTLAGGRRELLFVSP